MKIFKKGEESNSESGLAGVVVAPAAPDAAPVNNDIADLVDWYLNPDAPSPVVDQPATGWTNLATPAAPTSAAVAPAATPAPL